MIVLLVVLGLGGGYGGAWGASRMATALPTGSGAQGTGLAAPAPGSDARATDSAALAAGGGSQATGSAALATGSDARATGSAALATGGGSQATGSAALATGGGSQATGSAAVLANGSGFRPRRRRPWRPASQQVSEDPPAPNSLIPPAEGQALIVSLSSNRLTYYVDGKPVRQFPVATGRGRGATPQGHFRVVNKAVDPEWHLGKLWAPSGSRSNPLGSRWFGLSYRAPTGATIGLHGTNNPRSIGRFASRGCLRMFNRDIEWLFVRVPVGTPILIRGRPAAPEPAARRRRPRSTRSAPLETTAPRSYPWQADPVVDAMPAGVAATPPPEAARQEIPPDELPPPPLRQTSAASPSL